MCHKECITSDNFLSDEYWVMTFLWIWLSTARKSQKWVSVLSHVPRQIHSLGNVCGWRDCVRPQLNCKYRTRITAITAVIVNRYLPDTSFSSPAAILLFLFFRPAKTLVWKELWQCAVTSSHVSPASQAGSNCPQISPHPAWCCRDIRRCGETLTTALNTRLTEEREKKTSDLLFLIIVEGTQQTTFPG